MASLTLQNNYLETLVRAGADAQANLFVAQFKFHENSPAATIMGMNDADLNPMLTVRCPSFSGPEVSSAKYTNKFITASIPRPAAKVNVTRNFSIEFRVDANYQLYQALLLQQNVTFNPAMSYAASDIQSLMDQLFDTSIYTVPAGMTDFYPALGQENPESLRIYTFHNCWIASIDPLTFNGESFTPISVKLTCKFLQMEDMQTDMAVSG